MKATFALLMTASAAAITQRYIPQSKVYIQFIDNKQDPQDNNDLQLGWHAPPSVYDTYDGETGEFVRNIGTDDVLIAPERLDKYFQPDRFFPLDGLYNTHNIKYPGQDFRIQDKLETEPENSYDLVN